MAIIRYRAEDGSIKELKALRGPRGYTPKKGSDYFTSDEVESIVSKAVEVATEAARRDAVAEAISVMSAPTLAASNTWYKGTTAPTSITEIRIVDSYTPTGAESESWNADTEDSGEIKCYIEGTVLTMAGNGSGRIMANVESNKIFGGSASETRFANVEYIHGLNLLDTRNVETLSLAFAYMKKLKSVKGTEGWNVSKVKNYRQAFNYIAADVLDFSNWDAEAAVALSVDGTTWFTNMIANCFYLDTVKLNKSFDLSKFFLPVPLENGDMNSSQGMWVDADTGIVYENKNSDTMFDVANDGLPNPSIAGRNITFVAVWPESEVRV